MDKKTTKSKAVTIEKPVPEFVAPMPKIDEQPVRYVVAQPSLNGVSGILIFWIVVFAFSGLGMISSFFLTVFDSEAISLPTGVITAIFSPLLAGALFTTVVLIALRKKLAVLASFATVCAMSLFTIIISITSVAILSNRIDQYLYFLYDLDTANTYKQAATGEALTLVATALIFAGLVSLYFFTSKRVKQTLTE